MRKKYDIKLSDEERREIQGIANGAATTQQIRKRIFIGLSVLVGAVAVFVCVTAWRTGDGSITQALVDNAFDLLKVGVVSYFGKAALENRIKLAHFYPKLKNQILKEGSGDP